MPVRPRSTTREVLLIIAASFRVALFGAAVAGTPTMALAAAAGTHEANVETAAQVQPTPSKRDSLVDSEDPEASIPNEESRQRDPLLFGHFVMELSTKAVTAFRTEDYAGAIKFYRALAKAVPERASPWSKLCEIHRILHDPEAAETACREAIRRPGAVEGDQTAFVDSYLTNHRPAPGLAVLSIAVVAAFAMASSLRLKAVPNLE